MFMKIRVGDLRRLIQEVAQSFRKKQNVAGSYPDETYDKELLSDPAFDGDSTLVPHDIKKSIKKWAKDMKLSSRKD